MRMFSSSNWRPTREKTAWMGLLMSTRSMTSSALRPNERRVLMISAARSTWVLISVTTWCRSSGGISRCCSTIMPRKSLPILMALSGWFNSWAMPADISPSDFILLAWTNWASFSIISVMSVDASTIAGWPL